MKIATKWFFLLILCYSTLSGLAQKNTQSPLHFATPDESLNTELIVFKASDNKKMKDAQAIFKEVLTPSSKTSFQFLSEEKDKKGITHKKWQQYFSNIKVEFAVIALHGKNNTAEFLTSEYYGIAESFNVSPSISAQTAFQKALQHIGAQNYMWEYPEAALEMDNYKKPTGELVILPIYETNEPKSSKVLKLAYKFDMFATNPISRGDLYIDAQTNEVLFYNAIIKHANTFGFVGEKQIIVPTEEEYCTALEQQAEYTPLVLGTAATRYSGTRSIETTFENPNYSLNDTTRGNGVFTRDALNQAPGTTYPYVTNYDEFLDNNNNWTAAEWNNAAKDNAALDAHWGAMETYDYWLNIHGRNSYNGSGASIRSYVHVDVNYNNAFWNGSVMSYGDGSCVSEGCNGFDALTSIDVAAHEIGHAVTTFTSNLAYQRESGAMNEGFSDIWGAAIEYYAKGTGPDNNPNDEVWLIGDEIDRRASSPALRSMSNPTSLGQPDTYGGSFWINPNCGTPTNANDYCGVHTNSGVLNYWFYLLVEGGSGTNDIGSVYNVASIGMADASDIAYATLQILSSNSTYANARTLSIQATTTLFGACSPEVETVTNAWHAVGVGAAFVNTCVPEVAFATTSGNAVEGSECDYTDIDVTLTIAIPASANANVNFTVNGSSTATQGVDFDLLTPSVTFPSGTTTPQTMTLRVYEDSFVETNETIIIDFTVNANGGDAVANTSADTFTYTINNDDATPSVTTNVTIYSEDFDDGSYQVTTAGNTGSDLWQAGNTAAATSSFWTTTGNSTVFAFTNDDACNCNKANDRLTTTVIDLSGGYTSATLTFDHAFANLGETATVRFSTNGTTFTTVSTLTNTSTNNGGGSYTTPWVNNNTINIPAPYLGSSTFYVRFVYSDNNTWAYGMAVDNITVTAVTNTGIQTAVNSGTPDQMDISGMGSVYASDTTSGDVMADITNNNSFDYGCTDVAVNRAGTTAQPYNGSVSPNLVMDKTFTIAPTNTTGTGNTSLTFYFEEAEIAGWESLVTPSFDRNDLVIARGNATSITEIAPVTSLGAFGAGVTLSGDFTGLNGTYYFGPLSAFVACAGVTKTWNGISWNPAGVPDGTNPVVINGNYDTNTDGNLNACTLTINNGFTLTIYAGNYIQVENDITVNGSLLVEHQGSVVQIDNDADVINNGTINVNLTTPNLGSRDFMLLGSPMSGESRTDVWNSAFLVLNHDTSLFVPNAAVATAFPMAENFADDNYNNWIAYNGAINVGEGYIVRPQSGYGQPGGIFNYTYDTGTLNNGNVSFPIVYNTPGPTPADDKNASPNILANPYASAIWATDFINANAMVDEVYFWEHNTPPSPNLPGAGSMNFSMEDISMFNLGGGLAAASGGTAPNGYIATGQGFAIKANAGGTATFTNSMRRVDNNNTLRSSDVSLERIWLKVANTQFEMQSSTLITFTENATSGFDKGYDSRRMATVVSLYSQLEDGTGEFGIQSREQFNKGMKIPLGFSSLIEEKIPYEISIDNLEGANLIATDILLVDLEEQTTVNLKDGAYVFTSEEGTYADRFVLIFQSPSLRLGLEDTVMETVSIFPNPTDGELTIISPNMNIESVAIYDLQGREMMTSTEVGKSVKINIESLQTSVYFVTIKTEIGTITKRVVKR
ncbi:MAG: M4 family metallopeptidase [Flavobacteriaceae bacterium]|nr:M4 family metallopeptidase [Flavobacteriaceae bacterium]